MTTERPLFRQAVVEHRAKGKAAGRVFVGRDRTAARAFLALLALVAATVALSFGLRIEQSTSGSASPAGDGSVLLLPVGSASRLRPGLDVRIDTGSRTVRARVSSVGEPVQRDGVTYAVARVPVAVTGDAVVVLARRSLAATLLPGLAS